MSDSDKERGAYYTSAQVARTLVRWAIRSANDTVLDPSCGTGVFLEAACSRVISLGGSSRTIFGIELEQNAYCQTASKLSVYSKHPPTLLRNDFFAIQNISLPAMKAVVGNPPFIRFQRFKGDSRRQALDRAREVGVTISPLTSSWAPFVVYACHFLQKDGRLAMVLPREILQARYARPVLEFLQKSFRNTTFISFWERLFPGLDQDTLIVLAEGHKQPFDGFFFSELDGIDTLEQDEHEIATTARRIEHVPLISGERNIRHLQIPSTTLELYERLTLHPKTVRLGEVSQIKNGHVSGANRFFHLSHETVREHRLPLEVLRVAIFNSRALQGPIFSQSDWSVASSQGNAGYLLHIGDKVVHDTVHTYLNRKEALGLLQRYKLRTRKPWYRIPGVTVPPTFLSYMSGERCWLIQNEANVVVPNTFHTVVPHAEKNIGGDTNAPASLCSSWLSSLTRLSTELEGHTLGGGMLKLEPSEAKRVLLVSPTQGALDLKTVNRLVRKDAWDQVQEMADRHFLEGILELSERECSMLLEAVNLLSQERRGRRRVG
ncbi:MAG: N-6 DNA methylase [Trueperaceae bacterium]|nr:MAG: N-6 DNA methylase [Trueperaceae bacterium]